MRILVATPVAKTVEERYAHSLFGLCKYETARGNDVDLVLQRGPYIHINRNKFVEQFLDEGYEYLLQIDMDVMFPHHALESLLRHEKDIVFGMYVMLKDGKPGPTFFREKENGRYEKVGRFGGGLIEIDAAGTGLCLAHRRVFEGVRDLDPIRRDKWFDFDPGPPPELYYSEDITFCRRVKQAGFKLWGDCDIPTGHVKDMFLNNRVINTEGGMDAKKEEGRGRRSKKARRDRRKSR